MRTLLLTALLAGMPMMLIAADDAAFTDLVRKPVNTVCPIDGKPVDTRLQPVDITGPDGQNVMVGSCSDSCQKALRSMFGQDGYDAVKAAKANITIAAMKASSPSPAPLASGLATAPQATYGTAPAPYTPAPYATQSRSATAPYASPYETPAPAFGTAPVSEFGSPTSTGPVVTTPPKPKVHKHHVAPIDQWGEDSDERQIQKKAAQRADMGEPEVDDNGVIKPVVHHHKRKPKPATVSTSTSTGSEIASPGSSDPWTTKPAASTPASNPFAPTTGPSSFNSPAPSPYGSSPAPSTTYATPAPSPTPLYTPAPAATPAPTSAAPSALPAPSTLPAPAPGSP